MSRAAEAVVAAELPVEQAAPPRISDITRLRRELFAIANNNPAFKRGMKDEVFFTVGEGDRVEDVEDDSDTTEISYNYSAQRQRTRGDLPNVQFDFSAIAKHKNILLPPTIALKEFDMTPEEAAVAGGSVTREAEMKFTFDSRDGLLHLCESFVYYDADGDTISMLCSCGPDNDEEVAYVGGEADEEDEESTAVTLLDVPKQYPYFHVKERSTHERVSLPDVEAAKVFWASFLEAEKDLMADVYMRNVDKALRVVRLTRRALLIQAGFDPKTLPDLRSVAQG